MHQTLSYFLPLILKVIGTEVRQVWLARLVVFQHQLCPSQDFWNLLYIHATAFCVVHLESSIHNCIQVASNNLNSDTGQKELALEITCLYCHK